MSNTSNETNAPMDGAGSNETETIEVEALPLDAQIESILFVSSGPVTVNRLARTLLTTKSKIRAALGKLETHFGSRGMRLQWTNESIQLTTAPENSEIIERFLGLEVPPTRLSQAALEVLAIIAYMQPITRPQIDEIRGVNSDGALRTLLSKGLLAEVGRLDGPGRPILYGTTSEFMQYFGLNKLTELPPLPDTAILLGEAGEEEKEERQETREEAQELEDESA
ncbi:MAG: SMC-Scp complex subunit ScpB [Chloroflexota bacterium]